MDLASVVAALASVGVRVSGSTPNNNIQGDSSRACPTGLAGPEPSGTLNDPGQHFHRDDTLEVLMHPDVLELHAVRVVHTPHGDERQLHLKVRVRCRQEELVVDVLVDTGAQVSLVRRGVVQGGIPAAQP